MSVEKQNMCRLRKLFLLMLLYIVVTVLAQAQGEISGTVTDEITADPHQGVAVEVRVASSGTSTNEKGRFVDLVSKKAVSNYQSTSVSGFLAKDITDNALQVYANGELHYMIKGAHAKIKMSWAVRATQRNGDIHYSRFGGTRTDIDT